MAERDLKTFSSGWWQLSTLFKDIPTPAGFWIVERIVVQLAALTTGTVPTTGAGLEIGLYDRSSYMPLLRSQMGTAYTDAVFSDSLDNLTVRGGQTAIHVALTNPTATDYANVWIWARRAGGDDE